jgi:acetyl esterase/lipase
MVREPCAGGRELRATTISLPGVTLAAALVGARLVQARFAHRRRKKRRPPTPTGVRTRDTSPPGRLRSTFHRHSDPIRPFQLTPLPNRRHFMGLGALALAGCTATGALDALVPRGTYRAQDDLPYGSDPRQRLDAYLPLDAPPDAPAVVFFYGGAWTRGSRGDYRFVGEALASAGIVTLVADYRLSPAVRWTDILEDCAAAVGWAFEHGERLGASRQRIHLVGHSAGGYNAAMLALDGRWLAPHRLEPEQLAGWVGIAGPYNFLPISDPDSQRAFDWPATPADSQPVAHVSKQAPRTLLLAAREDKVVDPQRNSAVLAQRLQQAGVSVRLEFFEHVNHATIIGAMASPLRGLAPVRSEVVQFVTA